MIYQKIFTGERPFQMIVGSLGEYPDHRHADFELNYCISGAFDIVIDGVTHRVNEGCATFISPICSHRIPKGNRCRSVTVIVGVSLLKKHFDDFLKLPLQPAVFDLNTEKGKRIRDLFCECAEMKGSGTAEAELVITGNIYKILAYFMGEFSNLGEAVARERDLSQIESVEKALEQIYLHYREPLTVEGVADLVGYGKSNFCKIFKKTVGEGFHQALNRHRVACAEGLLKASRLSVAAVATEVGFADVKSFCRVFKAVKGISPGQYRKA